MPDSNYNPFCNPSITYTQISHPMNYIARNLKKVKWKFTSRRIIVYHYYYLLLPDSCQHLRKCWHNSPNESDIDSLLLIQIARTTQRTHNGVRSGLLVRKLIIPDKRTSTNNENARREESKNSGRFDMVPGEYYI